MNAVQSSVATPDTVSLNIGISGLFSSRLGVLGLQARNVVCYAVILACSSVIGMINQAASVSGRHDPLSARIAGWIVVACAAAAVLILLVNMSRRLNDLDFRRWWILLTLVPPVNIFLILFLNFWPGKDEANRFGNAPRPGHFECLVGIVGLAVFVALKAGAILRMEMPELNGRHASGQTAGGQTAETGERQAEKDDDYDEYIARFTAEQDRAEPIRDETRFREVVVDRAVMLVGEWVNGAMVFRSDGTLSGTFTQIGGRQDDSDLFWHWHAGALCYEGRIARSRIPRTCGRVSIVPDAGMRVEYEGGKSTEHYLLLPDG